MQEFLTYVNSLTQLSDKAQSALVAKMIQKEYPRKHLLVPDLALCDKIYFVQRGLLRVFYHNNEKEITDFFVAENGVVGPILRFRPIKMFMHSVDLLENSVVAYIHFADLEELFQEYHDIERLGRLIALQTTFLLQYRIDSIQFFSAEERYDDFIKTHPTILQRAPLGHIASYLGMNQVTLSKIRKLKK